MKALKPFDIAFVGLSNGKHEFEFALDKEYFDCFEGSEIVSSKLKGRLVLHKKSNMFDLEFIITGEVELECDRCLEYFWYPLNLHHFIYVKFGEIKEEHSDEVIIIPSNESHIDVSQYFYEFTMLGIPLKKTHADGKDNEPMCNPYVLKQLEKYSSKRSDSSAESDTEKPADSRWDALKNLKFNYIIYTYYLNYA